MEEIKKQGLLILIGGAEDRRDDRLVLKSMLERTNAKNIIIIPTASYYSREVYESYVSAFSSLGVENIETFDIRYEDEADNEEYHQKLNNADLVYFTGGDQTKLIRTLYNSELLKKIRKGFQSGKLHIAGTSAGAAAAGHITIYDGDYQGFNKNAVTSTPAFGFIDDLIIDTHFLARERIPRMVQSLVAGTCKQGIGIDEDTAVIIYPDMNFEVCGSGMVSIFSAENIKESNYNQISDRDIYTVNGIQLGFLAPGTLFSLKHWSILKTVAEKNQKLFSFNIFPNY
ncbi:MAG TPA: cyanophycinase [Bacteroidales bacterium]|nr:cyanophycinase [Bacteroidales bacterium]